MRLRALADGEWPTGIHWTVGEERTVPADWPGADVGAPAWLVELGAEGAIVGPDGTQAAR